VAREARFEQLYNATYRKTLAYVLRRTQNATDAHDVVADTYLVAWRRLDELMQVREPQAWLYGVAYRTLGNLRRTGRRQDKLLSRAPLADANQNDLDPARSVEVRDQLERVTLAIAQLPERDQEILRLIAYEGLDRAAIGIVLGINARLVGTLVYRARRRLEATLAAGPTRQKQSSGHTYDGRGNEKETSLIEDPE
jgi:RNA polymerase sigma factor (sigma-70 family)